MRNALPGLLVVLLLVLACEHGPDRGSPAEARDPAADGERPLTLGGILFMDTIESEWADLVVAGFEAGAREAGVELLMYRHDLSFEKEQEYLNELIVRRVDGIVMTPLEAEQSVFLIGEAHKAGIAIACAAVCIQPEDAEKYVSVFYDSDNAEMGYRTGSYAAQWIARHGLRPARIAFIHSEVFPPCYARGHAFRSALDELGVDWIEAGKRMAISTEQATATALEMLAEDPEIDILFADGVENTRGVVIAARRWRSSQGPDRQVVVFGTEISREPHEVWDPTDEVLLAVSTHRVYEFSRRAVLALAKSLRTGSSAHYQHLMDSPFFAYEDSSEPREPAPGEQDG